jgi:hypothetical protein
MIGLMYSYVFVAQQKNMFIFSSPITTTALFFGIRIALIAICAWYLLHSTMRESILLLTSYIMTFWVFLLLKKARLHDGS